MNESLRSPQEGPGREQTEAALLPWDPAPPHASPPSPHPPTPGTRGTWSHVGVRGPRTLTQNQQEPGTLRACPVCSCSDARMEAGFCALVTDVCRRPPPPTQPQGQVSWDASTSSLLGEGSGGRPAAPHAPLLSRFFGKVTWQVGGLAATERQPHFFLLVPRLPRHCCPARTAAVGLRHPPHEVQAGSVKSVLSPASEHGSCSPSARGRGQASPAWFG